MHGLHSHRRSQSAGPTPAAPEAGGAAAAGRSWSLLILLSVAQFMVVLDGTVVNVALPSIARSLNLAAGGLQWVVTAYVLASGGLLLLGGRAADTAGRRRLFLAGLGLFTAASLASGLAPSAGALIAARAGQGTGAALLTPAALSIITTAYAGTRRARAISTWGALGGAGAAVGVLAGGILTTWLGWRSVFLVNVPVGITAGLIAWHMVPRPPRRTAGRRQLDLAGSALVVAGLVTLVYGISGAPAHGWGSARTVLLIVAAIALLTTFALVERGSGRPLVPAALRRSRSLSAGVLAMLGATAILVGTFFLNSLYLQQVQGASALRVGLDFLPLALIIGVAAHLAARLLPVAGSRLLLVGGLILMAAGALALTRVWAGSAYVTGVLPGLLIIGAGTGLALPAAAVTALDDIPEDQAGVASGLLNTAHDVGAALGVAVLSALAIAVRGGVGAGYRHGFVVLAATAVALAILAAVAVPAVRPAEGTRVAIH